MTSSLNAYLSFGGNAREAMEFYADVFGGAYLRRAHDVAVRLAR